MGAQDKSRPRARAIGRAATAAIVACASALLLLPAQAQFWGGGWGGGGGGWGGGDDWGGRRRQQQNPFGDWFGNTPRREHRTPREAPVDSSKAPAAAPRKAEVPVTTPILVLGDGMADWLASGLEDAFAEKPEIAIMRKNRASAGLIRYEARRDIEWPQIVREAITADKPKFIVMMIGINDRQPIRVATPPAAAPGAGAPRAGAPKAAPPAGAAPAAPAPAAPEARAPLGADEQNAELEGGAEPAAPAAPEPARGTTVGTFEFHTEKWEAAYVRRIDATIAAMKSAGVPVFWVGLPSQRSPRASSDGAYLNELYRQRAERAGIIYIDVWDGFVDEAGRFTPQGADFEGQTRRLRSGDGIYFTKYGARKLAHYVEREIQRNLVNRAIPVALPAPEPAAPGARPGPGAVPGRPMAGPVVPLTLTTTAPEELMGGARAPARPPAPDPTAARVLTRGEPIGAAAGRADDFIWPPRGGGVLGEPLAGGPEAASVPPVAAIPVAPADPAAAVRPPASAPKAGLPRTEGGPATDPQPVRRRPRADQNPRPPASINPFGGLFGR